jgi:hypothetical protein
MAKTHFFDVSLAVRYGPIESIILTNLCWWLEKNKENGRHYVNERYWVYNSIKAFEKLFPYLNGEQIRRTIERLKEKGALYVGKFNKTGYDRTLWYSVSDEVLDLYRDKQDAYIYKKYTTASRKIPNGKLHLSNSTNAISHMGNTKKENDKNLPEYDPPNGKEPEFGAESGSENPLKPDNSGGNDRERADLPEYPDGKLHLSNLPNAIYHMGNTKEENDKNPPECDPPDGQKPVFVAEFGPEGQSTADGNDRMVNSIWQKRQIDLANLPNRFVENAEPIPDIGIYNKPAAALPEKDSEKAEAAARPLSLKISQEMIRDTLKRVNGELEFDEGFYPKAEAYMNCGQLDTGYLEFIYRECQDRKPEKFRGMYYTLIFQKDLAEIYKNIMAERRQLLIHCPVCGAEYGKNQIHCPECDFPTDMRHDEAKVCFERKLYHLDDEEKERYVADLSDLYKIYKNHPDCGETLQEHIKGLGKKYHLLE